MNDVELRALVRDAVARHLGGRPELPPPAPAMPHKVTAPALPHPSHGVYIELVNSTGACVIEPSV